MIVTNVRPGQYAIRHTMRNHTILKSEAVIKMIAGMVKPEHKVNLRTPDKVVLVEIFQVCSIISHSTLLLFVVIARDENRVESKLIICEC